MIEYRIATNADTSQLMQIRMETLRTVNNLPDNHVFEETLVQSSLRYFEQGNQTTVLAFDGCVIGCASLCYVDVMPTPDHTTGKRAHLMNVYTNTRYRRQGIAQKMLDILLNEAAQNGVTEISLDATESGRPLYQACGFAASQECMVRAL